ncbi:hypothetical protein PTKIN_Ptkin12aG0098100 [Pterospermum kingtungense]
MPNLLAYIKSNFNQTHFTIHDFSQTLCFAEEQKINGCCNSRIVPFELLCLKVGKAAEEKWKVMSGKIQRWGKRPHMQTLGR